MKYGISMFIIATLDVGIFANLNSRIAEVLIRQTPPT